MELTSVGLEFTPAAPLHIQCLDKALRLDVLLREAEKVLTEDLRYSHNWICFFAFKSNNIGVCVGTGFCEYQGHSKHAFN